MTLTLVGGTLTPVGQRGLPEPDDRPGTAGKPIEVFILMGQSNMVVNRGDGLVFDEQSGRAVTGGTIAGNDGYGIALLGSVRVGCKDVRMAGNQLGKWKVAKTVPNLTQVVNYSIGRDDRRWGRFG